MHKVNTPIPASHCGELQSGSRRGGRQRRVLRTSACGGTFIHNSYLLTFIASSLEPQNERKRPNPKADLETIQDHTSQQKSLEIGIY
jgi:hypothetical protein